MRQVILRMSVSLDGYVAGPRGGLRGSFPEDEELTSWKLAPVRDAGTHIMGRVTYEQMAAFWPTATNAYAASMKTATR
jgi:dihydrofolate reductase